VWAVENASQRTILRGHEGSWGVNDVSFRPDGKRVATSGSDGTVRVWDAATGKQLLLLEQPPYVSTVMYSPDGSRILSASQDKTARIWDAQTGAEMARLDIHTDIVQRAEFSHNGNYVVTASNDHTAGLWDFVAARDRVSELCRRVSLSDRVLSKERRNALNLPSTPRDPCRLSYFGLAPILDRMLR
jgi:WD40 repeat protein